MRKTILLLFLWLGVGLYLTPAYSQKSVGSKAEAQEKMMEGIRHVDKGEFEAGIRMYEEAKKIDPTNPVYDYEIAYAYYMQKKYDKAIGILDKLVKGNNSGPNYFQLLGNSYDMVSKPEKAVETYKKGLEKFPKAGQLYLELGVMSMGKEQWDDALGYWEKGLEMDPKYPSNYYWASKIYSQSTEPLWCVLYGEMFMNLERNTKRTAEISKLIYDVYQKAVTVESDTSVKVEFSKQANVISLDPKDLKKKNPDFTKLFSSFPQQFEMKFLMAALIMKKPSIEGLSKSRNSFINLWFGDPTTSKNYPNMLFDFQKQLKDKGYFECYNYWVFMKGNEEEFDAWYKMHKIEFDKFLNWFNENPLKVSENSRLYRLQYN